MALEFRGGSIELDAGDRLIATCTGPRLSQGADPAEAAFLALAAPLDFPPLRHAVVPGDIVVIANDGETPCAPAVIAAACQVLFDAGVEAGSITVLCSSAPEVPLQLPEGVEFAVHNPDDKEQMSYLATTQEGRRVYLNRRLTDADFVLPVGRLTFDPAFGYRGPWSTLFPGMSDTETRRSFALRSSDDTPPDPDLPSPALLEASEVCWLIGCQFHVGVLGEPSGPIRVVAGLESSVQRRGAEELDANLRFRAPSRAEVVIASVEGSDLDALTAGLNNAVRLARRGGKIVILSGVEGDVGMNLARVRDAGDPRSALAAIKGGEGQPDYFAARAIAEATTHADVYLLSKLDPDLVEEMSITPLSKPEESRRLVAAASDVILVNKADLVRCDADED
ncbi:lactate racemase domain-containing protein [Isosphaeraceae bacterium EP7]